MYFKQVKEIVSGAKRCTQRVRKRGEAAVFEDDQIASVLTPGGVVKWRVGGVYCVAPTRGKPSAVIKGNSLIFPTSKARAEEYLDRGYKNVQIKVIRIELVELHSIDVTVAKAEGVRDVAAYEALWRTINKSRGVRWEDNPVVWRLWFEFVG